MGRKPQRARLAPVHRPDGAARERRERVAHCIDLPVLVNKHACVRCADEEACVAVRVERGHFAQACVRISGRGPDVRAALAVYAIKADAVARQIDRALKAAQRAHALDARRFALAAWPRLVRLMHCACGRLIRIVSLHTFALCLCATALRCAARLCRRALRLLRLTRGQRRRLWRALPLFFRRDRLLYTHRARLRAHADVKPARRADQETPRCILRQRIDGLARKRRERAPMLRLRVIDEQAAIRAAQQLAVLVAVKRAHEVALGVRADRLVLRRAAVEAADAAVCAEPDDALAVNEDGIDVIGTQPAARALEREVLAHAPCGHTPHALPVRADPEAIARIARERRHRADRRAEFHRTQRLARLIKPTVRAARTRAEPQLAVCTRG